MVETLPTTSADREAAAAPTSPTRRRRRFVALGLAGLAVLVIAVLVVRDVVESSFDRPNFPSLAEHPDAALHGTVAYFEGHSRCVWLVAAAGQPSKQLLCLPPMDMAKAAQLGAKETDPQLVWRADGRLEVTVFRAAMRQGEPPALRAGWQKIVDVASGAVEDVPAADVPSAPNLATRPTVSPAGQRITAASDPEFGRIKVMLTDASGTRTLLSAHGPGKYTYGLNAAFWAPNWNWIVADDGRILIVTTGEHPTTRILTDRASSGGGAQGDGQFSSFAVTSADVLAPPR